MSAVHGSPSMLKVASDHYQRLKPRAIAATMPRSCRHRGQRKRRKPGHDEVSVFPTRVRPFQGFEIGRRQAPQFERSRPQAETEDDARGLRSRVRPDMCAVRGPARRTDGRGPARILRLGVLRLLADGIGIA
jgi:hypothetical protein